MRTKNHYVIVIMTLCFTLMLSACGRVFETILPDSTESETTEIVTAPDVEYASVTFDKVRTLYGSLALVNEMHEYQFPTQASQGLVNIWEYCKAHIGDDGVFAYKIALSDMMLDGDAMAALHEWLSDFYKATGKSDIIISSAYRTYEEQEPFAVPAGKSNHHSGYGVTLKVYDWNGTQSLVEIPAYYNWLTENAHKYGFVVRYPDSKAAITGIIDYLEHFHYVGYAPAVYMQQNNLCLEEFVEAIKAYSHHNPLKVFGDNGQEWLIYYTVCKGDMASVQLPTNYKYTVSGDNDGGIIVCVSLFEDSQLQE